MSSLREAVALALAALCTVASLGAATELVYDDQWGEYGFGSTQFNYPTGIAIGPSGDIFVSDGGNNRIARYTPDGQLVMTFGGPGSTPGRFSAPDYLEFSPVNGDLYVTDKLNHRIQRFTEAGVFVQMWGSIGPGPGQFNSPWGIHVDSAGDVFVTSRDQERVQKFTSDGVFITQWGILGTAPGQFRKPHGIATDDEGNVYVSDVERHDVQKFDADGGYLLQWGSPGSLPGQFLHPHYITAYQGDILVVDWLEHPHGGRINRFTSSGGLIDIMVSGPQGTGELQFHTLYAIATDGLGYWFGAEWGNHRVQKLRSAAVTVREPLPLSSWAAAKSAFR